jgi:formiminotetrahydrofolate cyclodeaminase
MAVAVTPEPLESLLARMGSATPAAGGGAAAALVGAAAAALVAKVAAVAARHAPGEAGLIRLAAEARRLGRDLTRLIDRDEQAYARVVAAGRRRDGGRVAARRQALARATEVPLHIAGASVRALEQAAAVAGAARPTTRADLGAAAALAAAALEAAALVVQINIAELDGHRTARAAGRELRALLKRGTILRRRLAAAVGRPAP